jgi:toxin secretion/phage lysis holin
MRVFVIGVAVFIVMDILSGLLKALYNKAFKSSVMRKGLFHKAGEILVLGLLYLVEIESAAMGLDTGLPLFKTGCGYVALMEIGSIIENLTAFTPGIDNIIRKEKEPDGKENFSEPQ